MYNYVFAHGTIGRGLFSRRVQIADLTRRSFPITSYFQSRMAIDGIRVLMSASAIDGPHKYRGARVCTRGGRCRRTMTRINRVDFGRSGSALPRSIPKPARSGPAIATSHVTLSGKPVRGNRANGTYVVRKQAYRIRKIGKEASGEMSGREGRVYFLRARACDAINHGPLTEKPRDVNAV